MEVPTLLTRKTRTCSTLVTPRWSRYALPGRSTEPERDLPVHRGPRLEHGMPRARPRRLVPTMRSARRGPRSCLSIVDSRPDWQVTHDATDASPPLPAPGHPHRIGPRHHILVGSDSSRLLDIVSDGSMNVLSSGRIRAFRPASRGSRSWPWTDLPATTPRHRINPCHGRADKPIPCDSSG